MTVKDDKKIKFILRDYQSGTSKNIKKIYKNKKHNRFAGVILPTGAGKSFVAIEQLLSFNNEGYSEKRRNKEINKASMLYIAPRKEILSQVKLHIVKNVILAIPEPVLEQMTIEDINAMMKNDFPMINFKGINTNIPEIDKITDKSNSNDKINAILKQLDTNQITILVKNAFPNLKFKCYAGVKSAESEIEAEENEVADITDEDITEAEFIIVDEAHRLDASKWGPNFRRSLSKNIKAKILAITATPDKGDRNILAKIARMVYQDETVLPSEYIAKEIYVLEAVRDGIVNEPDISECESSLVDSEQYRYVLSKYENSENDDEKKFFGEILDEMERIIGFSPRELNEKEIEEKKEENIKDTINNLAQEGKLNLNGKYIAFIPNNIAKNGKKLAPEQFFREQIERIKEQFKEVVDENGNPVRVSISFVTSNTEVKIDNEGNPVSSNDSNGARLDNSAILKKFNDASNSTGGIKILLSNDMLNEGVHVEGIDGAIMLRKIDKDSLYLQQVGRCISSLNPKKTCKEQPRRLIIDAVGNTLKQINKQTGKKTSPYYDLEKIAELRDILMKNNGEIPNINQQPNNVEAEKQARYAISLKRLKAKYMRYKKNKKMPIKDADIIAKIIEIANEINLWDINIPLRTIEPSERELTGLGFLEMSPTQKQFMDLYYKAYQKTETVEPTVYRINKLINIIRVLKNHKQDLTFPQGISIKIDKGEILNSSDVKSVYLNDILRENFNEEEIKQILVELKDYDLLGANNSYEIYHDNEEYDLGNEIAFVRGMFWTSEYEYKKIDKKYFGDHSVEELIETGIIQNGREDLLKLNEMNYKRYGEGYGNIEHYIDEKGRLKPEFSNLKLIGGRVGLIDEYQKCSLIDGRQDLNRYDIFGYSDIGFNKDNIHQTTGTKLDERGFYYDDNRGTWINIYSGSEYDLLGHNVYGYNEMGFERPVGIRNGWYVVPKWHKRNEDGTYDSNSYYMRPKEKGIESQDAHGFTGKNKNEGPDRKYDSKKETNLNGFYSYGGRRKRPSISSKKPITREDFFDNNGLDIDGYNKFNFKLVRIGDNEKYIHRETSCEYDKKGRIYRNGKLLLDQSIAMAKEVIKYMLCYGNSFEQVVELYKQLFKGVETERIKEYIVNELEKAFKIYETSSPKAFDKDESEMDALGQRIEVRGKQDFNGLDEYYFSYSNSTEKKERLREFFEICPRAKAKLQREIKENLRKLEILTQKKELTQEEKKIKEQLEKNNKKYQNTDFDGR